MMNDYEEDLDDFPVENKERPAEIWLEHIAQSRQINIQQEVIPSPFDGSTSWFTYVELIDDWLDLTVLEAEKRGSALKNRLVGDAEMYKGLLDRESLKAADGVKYFRNTLRPHFIKGSQGVPLEILSVHPSKKRKFRNGQVDRQVFIVFAALRCSVRRNA